MCLLQRNRGKSKKESEIEANIAQVVSTHVGTSMADRSKSDSSVFSFSVTTPIVGYSGDSERLLNTELPIMYALIRIVFLALRR